MVCFEFTPLAKVGGLADAVAGLASGLCRNGWDARAILPAYPWLMRASEPTALSWGLPQLSLRQGLRKHTPVDGVPVYLIEDPRFRLGAGIYTDPATHQNYPDAGLRYAALAQGALALCERIDWIPDVLHVHDAHPAILPSLLKRSRRARPAFARTRTVLTIHNLGYHESYPPDVLDTLELDRRGFYPGGPLEFYGNVNYLKAGILDAHAVTTVSPTYAREIQTSPELGAGLDGVLASRSVVGILNGIDRAVWGPRRDPHLAVNYDAEHLESKRGNRRDLLARTGLEPAEGAPVAGVVSRLAEQKGFDLLLDALPGLSERGIPLVVLGSGDPGLERAWREAMAENPRMVHYVSEFDDPLAHRIQAGADLFLMPSRYEPCGLTQMIAFRYGTVPVVHRTGGLADTVHEGKGGNGFRFDALGVEPFLEAIDRARALYARPIQWAALQRRGMAEVHDWTARATEYSTLYRNLS